MLSNMEVIDRKNIGAMLLLELLSLSPIFMILGNLLPAIGLKIHHYVFGLAFVLSVYHLALDANKKWIFYVAGLYLVLQFFLPEWDIKTFIDYFFGPFTLLALSSIALNRSLPVWMLKKYVDRLLFSVSVPLAISFLQFFNLLPYTLLNADYLNYTDFRGNWTPRPNGWLYHGSELAVMIYFMGVFSLFKSAKKALPLLLFLLLVAGMTLYKSIIASMCLLTLYYVVFLDKEVFYTFRLIDRKRLFTYLGLAILVAGFLVYDKMAFIYKHSGYPFTPTLLTGRGSIWNIYLEGIKEFSAFNYLFGSGMGSEFGIFEAHATAENFYPLSVDPVLHVRHHTHNSLLSIFINSGFVGLAFVFFLFYSIYKAMKMNFNRKNLNKFSFAIFILPLFLIGITIPIFNKAIFWVLMGFAIINWSYTSYGIQKN